MVDRQVLHDCICLSSVPETEDFFSELPEDYSV
jgi:hypothetical protein